MDNTTLFRARYFGTCSGCDGKIGPGDWIEQAAGGAPRCEACCDTLEA